MKEAFVQKKFSSETLGTISQANAIIRQYRADGFTLTLRQLYYQFVARGLIPNKQTEYKRIGSIINDGRLAGLIDWDAIEDRTRNVRRPSWWDGPEDVLHSAANGYAENLWDAQPYAPEVWIEKDALVGVIEPVCGRWRLPSFACRGYTSQSEQYRAGKRFGEASDAGKIPLVLHLGDHDPSGIDMTRDNMDRLTMFAGVEIEVRRLALNFNQVQQYNPPPNPAKDTDSRHKGYQQLYGDESWELDALDPHVIDSLIDQEIRSIVDQSAWDSALDEENKSIEMLKQIAENWEDVEEWLKNR